MSAQSSSPPRRKPTRRHGASTVFVPGDPPASPEIFRIATPRRAVRQGWTGNPSDTGGAGISDPSAVTTSDGQSWTPTPVLLTAEAHDRTGSSTPAQSASAKDGNNDVEGSTSMIGDTSPTAREKVGTHGDGAGFATKFPTQGLDGLQVQDHVPARVHDLRVHFMERTNKVEGKRPAATPRMAESPPRVVTVATLCSSGKASPAVFSEEFFWPCPTAWS